MQIRTSRYYSNETKETLTSFQRNRENHAAVFRVNVFRGTEKTTQQCFELFFSEEQINPYYCFSPIRGHNLNQNPKICISESPVYMYAFENPFSITKPVIIQETNSQIRNSII